MREGPGTAFHPRFWLTMSAMLPPPRRRALGLIFFSRRPLQAIAGPSFDSLPRARG